MVSPYKNVNGEMMEEKNTLGKRHAPLRVWRLPWVMGYKVLLGLSALRH
jgi:hypothetical protein